jgi:hypothetical protein
MLEAGGMMGWECNFGRVRVSTAVGSYAVHRQSPPPKKERKYSKKTNCLELRRSKAKYYDTRYFIVFFSKSVQSVFVENNQTSHKKYMLRLP